jgi:hypothetical protein
MSTSPSSTRPHRPRRSNQRRDITLAYLGEHYSAADSATTFAAYITGNEASNLIGRIISAGVAEHFGLAANFHFFAGLDLLGAALVYFTIDKKRCMECTGDTGRSPLAAWAMHMKNPALRASFAIRFCILFAFIGTFTHVNVHPRELRSGAATHRRRRHDPRLCLFRFPSFHRHHACSRARRETLRHKADLLGLAPRRRYRLTALGHAKSRRGAHQHGACRHRDILRASLRHRLCRPRGDVRPRVGERPLSGRLLLRWPHRQRGARRDFRHVRLGGLRRRHWHLADRCRPIAFSLKTPLAPEV